MPKRSDFVQHGKLYMELAEVHMVTKCLEKIMGILPRFLVVLELGLRLHKSKRTGRDEASTDKQYPLFIITFPINFTKSRSPATHRAVLSQPEKSYLWNTNWEGNPERERLVPLFPRGQIMCVRVEVVIWSRCYWNLTRSLRSHVLLRGLRQVPSALSSSRVKVFLAFNRLSTYVKFKEFYN